MQKKNIPDGIVLQFYKLKIFAVKEVMEKYITKKFEMLTRQSPHSLGPTEFRIIRFAKNIWKSENYKLFPIKLNRQCPIE